MDAFPDPSSPSAALETGLAAIKQGNYSTAIAALDQYLATVSHQEHPDALKAQMGLVVARARSGQIEAAIALCQDLLNFENQKVCEWASQMLDELKTSQPVATGFVPIESQAPTNSATRDRRKVFNLQDSEPQLPNFNPVSTAEDEYEELESIESIAPPLSWQLVDKAESSAAAQPATLPAVGEREPIASSIEFDADTVDAEAIGDARSRCASSWFLESSPRAARWQPFPALNPARLQWAEMGTVAAVIVLMCSFFWAKTSIDVVWTAFATRVLKWSYYIPSITAPIGLILITVIGCFAASPWILDAILQKMYKVRSLPTSTLAKHSPESYRLLQRFANERKIPLPKLSVLNTDAAIAFAYGCRPSLARIVVSRGLLTQLSDDEIAAIYASELGHIAQWSFSFLSLVAVVTQIPYVLYWKAAEFSDWLQNRSQLGKKKNRWIVLMLSIAADLSAIVSAAAYGVFRVLRWSGLWLSKTRLRYSDRVACNLTGNPNGVMRSIVKSAIVTTETIEQQGKTEFVLEGFELLTSIGYRNGLTIGSGQSQSIDELVAWELPYKDRHWLTLNNSHPLMGERLNRLIKVAYQWQVEPEFKLESGPLSSRKAPFVAQSAPFVGAALGFVIAQMLWIAAQIASRLGTTQLNWMATDYKLFFGFMLIGFGLGTIFRFNSLFPELDRFRARNTDASADLSELLMQPNGKTPFNTEPIRVEGTLLGRSGVANWLGQDLLLKTPSGVIVLHDLSQLGAIGNLLPRNPRPADLVGQRVIVTGWYRRGATPWIDIDRIQTKTGRLCHSGHDVWSTIVAGSTVLGGLIMIL